MTYLCWHWSWPSASGSVCQVSPLESWSFSLPLRSVFSGRKITVSCPHSRRGVLLHVLRRESLHQLFGTLLCRRFVSSPPHMHWFNYLSIWTHSTHCLLWVIMQYYFILLFRLVQFWSLGTLPVVSFVPLIILLLNYGFFFLTFPTSSCCKMLWKLLIFFSLCLKFNPKIQVTGVIFFLQI